MSCEYVNGLEKVESTDDVLTGNVGKEFVSYCTRYMRELEQYSLLKSLLDAVEKIDFLLAYYLSSTYKCNFLGADNKQ